MNLVIALLSTRSYHHRRADPRQPCYGYADSASDEAFSRMFERDKNELRDLGIPLETGRVSRSIRPRATASTATPTRCPPSS